MESQRIFALVIIWVQLFHCGTTILIDGKFTEARLKPGYNLVATIPKGAKSLNVTELRDSSNFLAIRLSDGRFALNGDYVIAWSGIFEAAGTTFTYFRQNSQHPETIAADGPLREPVDIMVLYQEPNPGIVYRYQRSAEAPAALTTPAHKAASRKYTSPRLPRTHSDRRELSPTTYGLAGDQAQPTAQTPIRRLRRRRFAWKNVGLSECNKSCGGGIQTTRFTCVRELSQMRVLDRRCHHLAKPVGQTIRCNTRPCPAKWRAGPWSTCSVTCGSGIRTRELECVQEITQVLTMRVSDGACIEPNLLPVSESCSLSPCDENLRLAREQNTMVPSWTTGAWSECSTSCGVGKKTRTVTCITTGRACPAQDKPSSQDICKLSDCPLKTTPAPVVDPPKSLWMYTEWSPQCSAECGTGVQWRKVFCLASDSGDSCDETDKPSTQQECSSEKTCSGHWFTGPWTQCTPTCGIGEQSRDVVCLARLRGTLRVVLDINCPADKPEVTRRCNSTPCGPRWFTSDWSECSRSCGTGIQQREVKCLDSENKIPKSGSKCDEKERPLSKKVCNDQTCPRSWDAYEPDSGHRVIHIQNDPEVPDGASFAQEVPNCKDTYSNCLLVAQARLCNYDIYQRSCCESCSKSRQDTYI